MNELIKSEAEKYAPSSKYVQADRLQQGFTAGFNRCLELAKMDNEEAFEKYWESFEVTPHVSYNRKFLANHIFLAAAKLKDVEIMELNSEYDQACSTLKNSSGYINTLEEKLKLAVEALEFYGSWKSYGSSDHPFLERYSAEVMLDSSEFEYIEKDGDIFKQTFGGKRAREALEKIKAK